MEIVKMNEEELREALHTIMTWDSVDLVNQAMELLKGGNAVLVDALPYLGNGKYVKPKTVGRYRYKMILPICDKHRRLYSTDLFKGPIHNAINGHYAIYTHTRQKVIVVVGVIVPVDYTEERFEPGYKEDRYQFFKVETV